jgi:hypothetical protein
MGMTAAIVVSALRHWLASRLPSAAEAAALSEAGAKARKERGNADLLAAARDAIKEAAAKGRHEAWVHYSLCGWRDMDNPMASDAVARLQAEGYAVKLEDDAGYLTAGLRITWSPSNATPE